MSGRANIKRWLTGWGILWTYPLLGVAYAVLVAVYVHQSSGWQTVSIAVALATGCDPYDFREKEHLDTYPTLWFVAWLLHAISWVYVPAVVGLVVSRALSSVKAEQRADLKKSLRSAARGTDITLSESQIDKIMEKLDKEASA